MNQMNTSQIEHCILRPCSERLYLTSLQYACAGCPATQEALFKILYKRREESSSGGVRGGRGVESESRQSDPAALHI